MLIYILKAVIVYSVGTAVSKAISPVLESLEGKKE